MGGCISSASSQRAAELQREETTRAQAAALASAARRIAASLCLASILQHKQTLADLRLDLSALLSDALASLRLLRSRAHLVALFNRRYNFISALICAAQNGYAREVDPFVGLCRETWGEEVLWDALKDLPHGKQRRTRLMHAAQKGDAARVKWLLKRGARPNLMDSHGQTALLWESPGGCSVSTDAWCICEPAQSERGDPAEHGGAQGAHRGCCSPCIAWWRGPGPAANASSPRWLGTNLRAQPPQPHRVVCALLAWRHVAGRSRGAAASVCNSHAPPFRPHHCPDTLSE